MTIQKYRAIDLLIFSVISILTDVVAGLTGFAGLFLYVAPSIPILFLGYVRWGKWGLIPNVLVSLAHLLVFMNQGLGLAAANAISLLVIGAALFVTQSRFFRPKAKFGTVALSFTAVYLTMALVEWGLDQVWGFPLDLGVHLLHHGFSFLFGLALMIIIQRQKDLMVPMVDYLKKLHETQEAEKAKSKGNGLYDDESI
jgi:hypothetical protein